MKHLSGILLAVFCAVSLAGGENLLRNPDFRALDGKGIPEGWMIVGKTKFAPAPGGVTLSLGTDRGKQTQATVMQHLHQVLHGTEKTETRLCEAKRYACSTASFH